MFWFGLALCLLLGGEVGTVLAGAVDLDHGIGVTFFVVGVNLVPWTAIAGFGLLYGGLGRRRGLGGSGPTEAAAARIESAKATGDGPDLPLRLDLTVAPGNRSAFRVEARTVVNLMDLDDFRVGRVVVVDYEPARPWRVRVRRHPGAEWAARIETLQIDSAPAETRQTEPPGTGRGTARTGLAVAALGLLLSLWPFWPIWSSLG